MKTFIVLCLLGLAAGLAQADQTRYDGYKVYRVTPKTEEHVQALINLEASGVSFWDGPSGVGKASDILIAPHQVSSLIDGLRSEMDVEIYVEDVQALIEGEKIVKAKAVGDLTWDAYYHLPDIYAFLDAQEAKHSGVAKVVTYGQSYEGRDLKLIKISKSGETRPAIFLEANIHAREWITNAVATYIINELLNGSLTSLVDEFDFYIVPVVNPDGYEYTYTSGGDRLWRKTRSKSNSIFLCKGADANRNWGFHWLTGGSSTDPCSDTYAGKAAFSEPETQLLSEYYTTVAKRIVFYFDLHSYSQYFLIPYGYTSVHIPQYNEYLDVATRAANALRQRFGTQFESGNIVDMLYVSSGGSVDWIKGIHGTPLVIAAELRDTGRYGFVLPADQIIDSSLELIDALHVYIDHVRTKYVK